jgi:hypothetical protein
MRGGGNLDHPQRKRDVGMARPDAANGLRINGGERANRGGADDLRSD